MHGSPSHQYHSPSWRFYLREKMSSPRGIDFSFGGKMKQKCGNFHSVCISPWLRMLPWWVITLTSPRVASPRQYQYFNYYLANYCIGLFMCIPPAKSVQSSHGLCDWRPGGPIQPLYDTFWSHPAELHLGLGCCPHHGSGSVLEECRAYQKNKKRAIRRMWTKQFVSAWARK